MKLYLAGPVTGTNDFVERFRKGREALRDRGYEVVCPVEGCDEFAQTTLPWTYWMRRDIAMLVACHGVALLSGWDRSEGASLEHDIASRLHMPCFSIEEWLGQEPAEQLYLLPASVLEAL